ncbi:glucose-6-phosphate isomerase [Endozoicomonadaceae bacterium StTr2]
MSSLHQQLQQHCSNASLNINSLFDSDASRAERYTIEAAGLFLDYSRNRASDETLKLLTALAEECNMAQAIEALQSGSDVNNTECRPALHTAIRAKAGSDIRVNGRNVMPDVEATRQQIKALCDKVHSGEWKGYTGKPIRHIASIGIGGSHLGVNVVTDALDHHANPDLSLHYIVNIDPVDISSKLDQLDPETTLFVIVSKSFGTLETKENALTARRWLNEQGCPESDFHKHFIAVSANVDKAVAFGIAEENILPLWDWVGGRYSLWSAVSFGAILLLGYDTYERMLNGAQAMDEHFRTAPLAENMPVMMGLLSVWYNRYFQAESHAILSYAHGLRQLPNHLQQVDMESVGKGVKLNGSPVDDNTGTIIWGGEGTNGQHAYHQLLHQGTRLIPADFIVSLKSPAPQSDQHTWLFANALAQARALMTGKTEDQVRDEMVAKGMDAAEAARLAPHKMVPGNRPSNILLMSDITPETVGALLALYEHKVYVQSVIFGINAFDQWGVELGKVLGDEIYAALTDSTGSAAFDPATQHMIGKFTG